MCKTPPHPQNLYSPRAPDTLSDRRRFELDADRWAEFHAALVAPPRQLTRLKGLLAKVSILEVGDK